MNNKLVKIYALAVCFSALLCGAMASGFLLFNLVKMAAPTLTIDPGMLSHYRSNEAFRRSPYHPYNTRQQGPLRGPGEVMVPISPGAVPIRQGQQAAQPVEPLSAQEITKIRLEQRAAMLEHHQLRARQGMIWQLIILTICTLLFWSHWRLARKTA